jgi:hypothetical protein
MRVVGPGGACIAKKHAVAVLGCRHLGQAKQGEPRTALGNERARRSAGVRLAQPARGLRLHPGPARRAPAHRGLGDTACPVTTLSTSRTFDAPGPQVESDPSGEMDQWLKPALTTPARVGPLPRGHGASCNRCNEVVVGKYRLALDELADEDLR